MTDNKIFQKEVVAYLKEAGVSDDYIKEKQYEIAKKKMLIALDGIRAHIAADELHEIAGYWSFSPAGDGMGCDNHFINFSECAGIDRYVPDGGINSFDIKDMIDFLRERREEMK